MRKIKASLPVLLMVLGSQTVPVLAKPVSPSALPSYTPAGARQGAIWNPQMPSGWNSLTPWGQSINTAASSGTVEIRTFDMTCVVNGRPTQITSGLDRLEAGIYLAEPWFHQDLNTRITAQRTPEGTLKLTVPKGKVTHWWIRAPRPRVSNARDCRVTSQMRMSKGVFSSIGGDFWLNPTTGWQGQDVANIAIGISNWHDSEGGWQTVVMSR